MATTVSHLVAIALVNALLLLLGTTAPHLAIAEEDKGYPGIYSSNHTKDFKYLGSVDGKSYYVDRTYLNWTAASKYCQSFNLELASIETVNQWNFLTEEALSDIYNLWYWTSARESRAPSMFVWNETETRLDSPATNDWNCKFADGKDYHYCASLRVRQNQTSEMYPESCSARNCVLCQSPSEHA